MLGLARFLHLKGLCFGTTPGRNDWGFGMTMGEKINEVWESMHSFADGFEETDRPYSIHFMAEKLFCRALGVK
ncbi:unnamed protein product, partial [marine sediment metagenome]